MSGLNSLISQYAQKYGVPDDLAQKQVMAESSGNPHAVSKAGAQGLLQLMPDTAKSLGVTNPFDPRQNLDGGMRYLSQLKKQFGDWHIALAAYNWGPGNVENWLKSGRNPAQLSDEAKNYVAKITGNPFGSSAPSEQRGRLDILTDRVAPGHKKSHIQKLADHPYNFGTNAQQSAPQPSAGSPYNFGGATNPMDTSGGTTDNTGGNALGGPQSLATATGYGKKSTGPIAEISGHQDLPFILANARVIDRLSGFKDNRTVNAALAAYKKDPAAAMDQWGNNAPPFLKMLAQKFPKSFEGQQAAFLLKHPSLAAGETMVEEFFNPMATAEGGIAGSLIGKVASSPVGRGLADFLQSSGKQIGLGSPLYDIFKRAGTEGTQWAKGLISLTKRDSSLARSMSTQIFGGLTNDEQREVVRLSQGLKPDPQFFKQYMDLKKRADALRTDIHHVTNEQQRVGVLDKANTFDPTTYFPMKGAYDFGPQFDLESQLRGGTGVASVKRPKQFSNLDESAASGLLDKGFSPPSNYEKWRTQRTNLVTFEDAMQRAPSSLRLPSTPATRRALQQGQLPGEYVRPQGVVPGANQRLSSPSMRRSLIAPELWSFYQSNGAFKKFVDQQGSYLPGEAQSGAQRLANAFRAAIVANPLFHVGWNVSGNDAAARGLHNLGGPIYEAGGAAYNATKAFASQIGLIKPEQFVGGAKQYAGWLDRALKAGAVAEFGEGRASALGGDAAQVVTEKSDKWIQRLDKSLTRFSDFNKERTFGEKGEEAFAVSLFRDAVERGGMSDYDAGKVVREALGDYYNLDPKNAWSGVMFFMPWLKSNSKFWVNALIRKPQYLTAPAHAIRNYNTQRGDQSNATDYEIFTGKGPSGEDRHLTFPLPQRIVPDILNAATGGNSHDLAGAVQGADKILLGRANPFVRAGYDAIVSATSDTDPNLSFESMFNRKAPLTEQLKEVGKYLVGHGLPIPLVGFVTEDIARRGVRPDDLPNLAYALTGIGYGSESMTDQQKKHIGAIRSQFEKTASRINRIPDNGLRQKALQHAYDVFYRHLQEAGVVQK